MASEWIADATVNFGMQGQIWWDSMPIAFRSIDNSSYFLPTGLSGHRVQPHGLYRQG